MKIVHAFFTSSNRRHHLAIVVLLLLLSIPIHPLTNIVSGASLPKQIGRLNDYGNVLTMEDQEDIEKKLNQLSQKGIGLTILISKFDPFSEPGIYASEIRREWGIRKEKDESLIVFVREGESWAVRTFLRPGVTNLFSSGGLVEYQDSITENAEQDDVREAVRKAVSLIHREAFPPEREPVEESSGGSNGLLIYIIAGGSGGLILVVLVLRWEGRRRCPRCGARLETVRTRGGSYQGNPERHCPECGYHERS